MKRHVLISTTHNFKISLTNLEYVCECLKANFEKVYLTVSNTSDSSITNFIKNKTSFNYKVIPPSGAGDARREALSLALFEEDAEAIYLYCDFDKVAVAMLERRNDFEDFVRNIPPHLHYLIVGRNKESFSTFPDTWQNTEKISNSAASIVFNIADLDITSGCCAFDYRTGKKILQSSKQRLTDTEWPIICKACDIPIEFKSVPFLIYIQKFNHGRNDDNWKGYIPRLTLALEAIKSLENKIDVTSSQTLKN
ncbi:hypothetical protein [Lacticaseibacillus paracasei]|uniref:hypothetical protein n=1 Tax=Lacticaseibacillus paracasei TaxID=1597 RepID=UPI001D02D0AC|nr:hypothetical protein [Lacticaseibacillus paracasei]